MPKILSISLILFIIGSLWSCTNSTKTKGNNNKVQVVGAMKDAMWKGEIFPKVELDTIKNRDGLYGIGPMGFMRGELLILDGIQYLSYIDKNDSLVVEEKSNLGAPFFVYANASVWDTIDIPDTIKTLLDIEDYISKRANDSLPFVFKLKGTAKSANIHVQNLPEGSVVTSPKEAHLGQRQFYIENKSVEIIGFYSTQHQGIFTHHDAYTHMHLITDNRKSMGHLDDLVIDNMKLLLPKFHDEN